MLFIVCFSFQCGASFVHVNKSVVAEFSSLEATAYIVPKPINSTSNALLLFPQRESYNHAIHACDSINFPYSS